MAVVAAVEEWLVAQHHISQTASTAVILNLHQLVLGLAVTVGTPHGNTRDMPPLLMQAALSRLAHTLLKPIVHRVPMVWSFNFPETKSSRTVVDTITTVVVHETMADLSRCIMGTAPILARDLVARA